MFYVKLNKIPTTLTAKQKQMRVELVVTMLEILKKNESNINDIVTMVEILIFWKKNKKMDVLKGFILIPNILVK